RVLPPCGRQAESGYRRKEEQFPCQTDSGTESIAALPSPGSCCVFRGHCLDISCADDEKLGRTKTAYLLVSADPHESFLGDGSDKGAIAAIDGAPVETARAAA